MGKAKIIAGGVFVVLLVLLAFFVIGPMFIAPFAATMTVEHYNDGDLVAGSPLAYLNAEGQEVDELVVKFEWCISGTDIQVGTLDLDGTLKIYLVDQYTDKETLLKSASFSEPPTTILLEVWYPSEFRYSLATLLPDIGTGAVKGWTIHIYGTISATIKNTEGTQIEAPGWSDDVFVGYGWTESGTLTLDARWTPG